MINHSNSESGISFHVRMAFSNLLKHKKYLLKIWILRTLPLKILFSKLMHWDPESVFKYYPCDYLKKIILYWNIVGIQHCVIWHVILHLHILLVYDIVLFGMWFCIYIYYGCLIRVTVLLDLTRSHPDNYFSWQCFNTSHYSKWLFGKRCIISLYCSFSSQCGLVDAHFAIKIFCIKIKANQYHMATHIHITLDAHS